MSKTQNSDERKLVRLERGDDGITILHLDDAAGRNALSEAFVHELIATLSAVGEDEATKVLILRGLDEVFCSGGDKDMLLSLAAGKLAASDIMVSRAVLEVPVPTIAAMEGHAVGGGLTLGLCCDVLLMAEESSYGCSFMNMGFTPGMGTTRLLNLAVGEFVAAEMMFGGQFFRGSHFVGRGQVNYVLPKGKLWRRAVKVARGMAEKPRPSLVLLKRYLSLAKRQAFEEARTVESFMHELSFGQQETQQLIEDYYPKS